MKRTFLLNERLDSQRLNSNRALQLKTQAKLRKALDEQVQMKKQQIIIEK